MKNYKITYTTNSQLTYTEAWYQKVFDETHYLDTMGDGKYEEDWVSHKQKKVYFKRK